ncbi:MAG: hypothetical protein QM768_01590 [Agriterribacter sp.]
MKKKSPDAKLNDQLSEDAWERKPEVGMVMKVTTWILFSSKYVLIHTLHEAQFHKKSKDFTEVGGSAYLFDGKS